MTAINRTPWAARLDEGERIIRNALRKRATAIERSLAVQVRLAARAVSLKAA